MIKKIYRLSEKQIKKVLQIRKSFFANGIILNVLSNTLSYNRFAIIIGGKSIKNNVERNYFRRFFYNLVKNYIFKTLNSGLDIVFIVKKQNILDKKNHQSIKNFEKDIFYLLQNVLGKIN